MAVTQYIGARYVPIFADPIEWSSTKQYEPLTIVTHEGNSYTSRQFVPVGIDILNETYWALTGNYNAQVDAYRAEVSALSNRVDDEVAAVRRDTDDRINEFEEDSQESFRQFMDSVDDRINDFADEMVLATYPTLGYEGTINVSGYNPASAVLLGNNTMLLIFSNATNDQEADCAYKIVQVGASTQNRVITSGHLERAGHANGACVADEKLYVCGTSQLMVYNLASFTLLRSVSYDIGNVSSISYNEDENTFYVTQTVDGDDGSRNLNILTIDVDNGITSLIRENILPDSIAKLNQPLRNDAFFYKDHLFISLRSAKNRDGWSSVFVTNIANGNHGMITIPAYAGAFANKEIEGMCFDPISKLIYISSYTDNNTCVIASFCPFTSVYDNFAQVTYEPNQTFSLLNNIRCGDVDESVTIFQSGNSDTPFTSLENALSYKAMYNNPSIITLTTDMKLKAANLWVLCNAHINLNNHTLSGFNDGNITIEGNGVLYIRNGTIGSNTGQQRGVILCLSSVDMSGETLNCGRNFCYLENVTNVNVQINGLAGAVVRN